VTSDLRFVVGISVWVYIDSALTFPIGPMDAIIFSVRTTR